MKRIEIHVFSDPISSHRIPLTCQFHANWCSVGLKIPEYLVTRLVWPNFEREWRDPRTTHLVRIAEGECRNSDRFASPWIPAFPSWNADQINGSWIPVCPLKSGPIWSSVGPCIPNQISDFKMSIKSAVRESLLSPLKKVLNQRSVDHYFPL